MASNLYDFIGANNNSKKGIEEKTDYSDDKSKHKKENPHRDCSSKTRIKYSQTDKLLED